MHKIQGVFCAALTPFNEDYSINNKMYLTHCRNLLSIGLDGLGVFGTTGEANSLSIKQKINAINFLVENKIQPNQLIVGTGLCSIQDSITITKTASSIGARAALVLPPFYYKNVTNEGVINFYRSLIEGVKDENFLYILYNFPALSGITINFEIIENLIKLYPNNVVGMKDSTGDIDTMLKTIKYFNNFSVFSGSDSLAVKICQHGGAGAITATSNISGKLLCYLIKNFANNSNIENFNELQNLQEKIREIATAQESISILKAFLSIKESNESWNRLLPPLLKITQPQDNKIIIGLIELCKRMNNLLSDA